MSRATHRLKATLLAEILAEDVPALPEDWRPPKRDIEVVAALTVTITALGGRPLVVVAEDDLLDLVARAGGIVAPEVTRADLGKLITAAKDAGNRSLVNKLVQVKDCSSPVYTLRANGRLWRPRGVNPNAVPTGIQP